MDSQPAYIGMDLGTFKTSVVSSNGIRESLFSAVGWPKDHVARAILGRDVVFGTDVVEKRLALKVCRPFQRGALKYLDTADSGVKDQDIEQHREAAKLLVKHAVELTRPTPGVPVYGVIGVPSRASIINKQFIMDIAADAFDAVAVAPEPFTVAFGMNALSDAMVIDIGAGTIDICPLYSTYPTDEDQVTVPLGGDSVDETFIRLMAEQFPEAELSQNVAREIKEKYGYVHDIDEKAIAMLDVKARPTQFDVSGPLKEACLTLVEPIIEGLREVISRFDSEFRHAMLSNIILAGGGSQMNGLDRLIEQSLEPYGGGRVRKVGDSVYAGAAGALKLAMSMPASQWDQFRLQTAPTVSAKAA
ncbi:MAG: rod shape-determining protein [Planctomycetota bacterium]|nr:rod shape-determining protein [Planctomycetota bacterium]MDA1166593.1 rod shape-determining protein [Planctomycetota bacterium]